MTKVIRINIFFHIEDISKQLSCRKTHKLCVCVSDEGETSETHSMWSLLLLKESPPNSTWGTMKSSQRNIRTTVWFTTQQHSSSTTQKSDWMTDFCETQDSLHGCVHFIGMNKDKRLNQVTSNLQLSAKYDMCSITNVILYNNLNHKDTSKPLHYCLLSSFWLLKMNCGHTNTTNHELTYTMTV